MSTLRAWFFTEMPYPFYPPEEVYAEVRLTPPSALFDPDAGHLLLNRYLDMHVAMDELGLDVMLNEHHQTFTCLNSVAPLHMAVLARETRTARILVLGNPVGNRPDPVRVAEEMATIDVLSRGRIEVGFVRGVPMEISATNVPPVDMKPRFWENVDLIMKAFTTHDGPFSWEGEHYHARQVNILPRPYQQPHPPIWITTSNESGARDIAERQWTVATIFNGHKRAAAIFGAYRDRCAELGLPEPSPNRFGYCGLVYVADTDEEAYKEAARLQWQLALNVRTPPQVRDVPGYIPPAARARLVRSRRSGAWDNSADAAYRVGRSDIRDLTAQGLAFVGNPDTVFEQMRDFYHAVGGLGHFLMMAQSHSMDLDQTTKSMGLFAREVLPRLREEVHEPYLAAHGHTAGSRATGT